MSSRMSRSPLVINADEYARILKWTAEDKEDPIMVQRREHIQCLKERSKQMTASWPNSFENVNKRNEEKRRLQQKKREIANAKFYKRYVKRKMMEQERLMYDAREEIFKNKDAPKMLLSAVIETAAIKDRELQIEFDKELKKQAEERRRQDDEEIIRQALEWRQKKKEQKQRRFDVNKKYIEELVEQNRVLKERLRKEYEEELNMQMNDNIMAVKEMEAIKEFEEKLKEEEKNRILRDMNQSVEDRNKRLHEVEELDKMNDKLIAVLEKSAARIAQRTNETIQEERRQRQERLEKLSEKLRGIGAAAEEREIEICEKARKEKEAIEDARREEKRLKNEKLRQERVEIQEEYLKKHEKEMQDQATRIQWETMNRFKNQELFEEYQLQKKEEKIKKIKEYREEILKLAKERQDREAAELAETRYYYGEGARKKFREADNKLLTYAKKLIDEAKEHGRPTYPIEKVVDNLTMSPIRRAMRNPVKI